MKIHIVIAGEVKQSRDNVGKFCTIMFATLYPLTPRSHAARFDCNRAVGQSHGQDGMTLGRVAFVIASGAKQSRTSRESWIASSLSLLAMTT
jgi:hypothetical protein